jgi:hypothetical protein
MASEEQINANRENGKLSHGAVTPEGRNICKMNALKHGLTGGPIVMAFEEVAAYEKNLASVFNHYKPVTDLEKSTVQEVADTKWKLLRIPFLESAIFAKGRLENQDNFGPDVVHPDDRFMLIEGAIQQKYSKDLGSLTLQQTRLQRQLERKIKEFKDLREEREVIETAHINIAMNSLLGDPEDTSPPHHTVGVLFSPEFLVSRLEFKRATPGVDLVNFDRYWRDKKAKTPA